MVETAGDIASSRLQSTCRTPCRPYPKKKKRASPHLVIWATKGSAYKKSNSIHHFYCEKERMFTKELFFCNDRGHTGGTVSNTNGVLSAGYSATVYCLSLSCNYEICGAHCRPEGHTGHVTWCSSLAQAWVYSSEQICGSLHSRWG